MALNPTVKEFLEQHPEKTLVGLMWSMQWRYIVMVYSIVAIVVLVILGIASLSGNSSNNTNTAPAYNTAPSYNSGLTQ